MTNWTDKILPREKLPAPLLSQVTNGALNTTHPAHHLFSSAI